LFPTIWAFWKNPDIRKNNSGSWWIRMLRDDFE
jgi:hypothetical protein